MLLRPSFTDLRLILHDLGRILAVVAAAAIPPLAWAAYRQEWQAVGWFLLMIGVMAVPAAAAEFLGWGARRQRVDWSHGLVVVALTWLVVPAVSTIPLWLAGHWGRWIDTFFETMSGITTTGLSLVQDLDHLPESVNLWRHTLQFLAGQGIVLAALTFFSASGALSMYQAEGREERIFPSVASTARFIWLVSVVHGIVAITALTIDGVVAQGFGLARAFFHASNVFMAAFDTGGFTPQSTSIAYYHSPVYEGVLAVVMVAGAMSFGLHHALWNRRRRLLRNLEIRTILTTAILLIVLTIIGLGTSGAFTQVPALARRGLFHVISAHTGTGFSTVSSTELARWSGLAFVGITVAMALGGMSSSTAGGVKSLRIGLTVKAMADTIREALLPEGAVVPDTFQQYGTQRLTAKMAQSVMAVSLLYVALYLLGAGVGYAYGYPLDQALFESVSAAANVGLSVGVTAPGMPLLVEIVMILQMWIGRLEFVSVFALIGFVAAAAVGE